MNEELRFKIECARAIVVHGGAVHNDEFIACAIARMCGCTAPIYRRNPTEQELADQRILVMDVGMKFEPIWLNFDHHQLPKSNEKCAYWILAEALGIAEELSKIPGMITWSTMDCQGPNFVSKRLGVDWETQGVQFLSPSSGTALSVWGKYPNGAGEFLLQDKAADVKGFLDGYISCKKEAAVVSIGDPKDPERPIKVLDVTACQTQHMQAQGTFADENKCAVILAKDDRGGVFKFVRRHDDPRIDFTLCRNEPYHEFTHNGGFILTTNCNVDIKDVITAART